MKATTSLKWVGLALLGILVAAVIAVAASRLASQQIGLASEPISAGRELAPKPSGKSPQGGNSPLPTTPSAPTPTPTTTPISPHENPGDGDSDGDD
jgi:hypothetical protein